MSAKKLIQPTLPFKLVNTPGDDVGSKTRKRKLCGSPTIATRTVNPMVELLNGGTKCFIKSDDQSRNNSQNESENDVNKETGVKESLNLIISSQKKKIEKTDNEISDVDTIKIDENVFDIDVDSNNSYSEITENNTSVNSTSDCNQLENTTPSSKKTTKPISAKKQEERLRQIQEKERIREEKQRLKQLEKEQKRISEIEAKRLRELEKEREKKQKEDEKKTKELERERERKQKENEKKAKELEKERERKQREDEKKAKELEKEREKKQKEEERKAKELEKEKQKEEKLFREEMEKKKNEKVKAAFVGFFKQKRSNLDTSKKDEEFIDQEQKTYFMPFQTKQDMKIAPFCRAYLDSDRKTNLEKCISKCEKNKDSLYLSLLKTKKHIPSKSEATWPVQVEDDSDVIIIETGSTNEENDVNKQIGTSLKNNSQKYCWKLLQFNENKRPPYWGTWRKKSLYVKSRRPFACDKVMFDYEIDSDDEWEEEDPGESIHGTDNEEEPEDDYEVDNDVFVPHGYLSDEEGQDKDSDSEEVQKEKLKLLGEEFEAEIKKKTERIKPRLVGCIWIPNDITNPENVSKSVADTLLKYRCIWDDEEPIVTEASTIVDLPKDGIVSETKKILLPDSIIPDLITFLHGNTNGIKVAAKNFIEKLTKEGQIINDNSISLSSARRTIKNIATKSTNVAPWCVNKEDFDKYGVEYPKNLENDVSKLTLKSSVKKITSFMTPQSQKAKTTCLEKLCSETDCNMVESEKDSLKSNNLFDNKESPKLLVKREQKVDIIGGKKRITPILLSPKKKLKIQSNSTGKSFSSEMEIL